jgi:predicted Fe-Mo cluster-binding NifX family protein
MKTAIASTGPTQDSKIDQRFSRCSFFAIYNEESGSVGFLANPNQDSIHGAGPATVELLASKGVQKVIAVEFGIKVKPLLDALQIQMIIVKEPEKSISDIINLLKNEK